MRKVLVRVCADVERRKHHKIQLGESFSSSTLPGSHPVLREEREELKQGENQSQEVKQKP